MSIYTTMIIEEIIKYNENFQYFCPSNQAPVNASPSEANSISPKGDKYLHVYCIVMINL